MNAIPCIKYVSFKGGRVDQAELLAASTILSRNASGGAGFGTGLSKGLSTTAALICREPTDICSRDLHQGPLLEEFYPPHPPPPPPHHRWRRRIYRMDQERKWRRSRVQELERTGAAVGGLRGPSRTCRYVLMAELGQDLAAPPHPHRSRGDEG